MNIASAVADMGAVPEQGPSLEWLTGSWTSKPMSTKHGSARFEFQIGADGRFEILGRSADDPAAPPYRREGPYRLEGWRLISPAIHDGEPTELRRDGEELVLIIDETLAFRLRRSHPQT